MVGFLDWFKSAATFSDQWRRTYPPAIQKAVQRIRPQVKQCFSNCQRIALFVERAVYVEGLADSGLGIPLLHSWILYRGEIIDPTWDLLREKERKGKRAYFGVRIGRESIRQSVIAVETWRPMLWFAYKKSQGVEDLKNLPPIG